MNTFPFAEQDVGVSDHDIKLIILYNSDIQNCLYNTPFIVAAELFKHNNAFGVYITI